MLLTIDETAALLKMTTRSVRRAWYDGSIPKPIRVGRRSIRWRKDELDTFLASQPGASRPQTKEFA